MLIAYRIRLAKGRQHGLKALDLCGLLRYAILQFVILLLLGLGLNLLLLFSECVLSPPLCDTASTRYLSVFGVVADRLFSGADRAHPGTGGLHRVTLNLTFRAQLRPLRISELCPTLIRKHLKNSAIAF